MDDLIVLQSSGVVNADQSISFLSSSLMEDTIVLQPSGRAIADQSGSSSSSPTMNNTTVLQASEPTIAVRSGSDLDSIAPALDPVVITATSALVTDMTAQNESLRIVPFFATSLWTATTARPERISALFLRSSTFLSGPTFIHEVLIIPYGSEVTCDYDAIERSCNAIDQHHEFLASPRGQDFLDRIYEELTGHNRQVAASLPADVRRCSYRFGISNPVINQLDFDRDSEGWRYSPQVTAIQNRRPPTDIMFSTGFAGTPSGSKTTLRYPGPVYDPAMMQTYGQDAVGAMIRDITGIDGVHLARISCLIEADGHSDLQSGLLWAGGAVRKMSGLLLAPCMDSMYLMLQCDSPGVETAVRATMCTLVERAKTAVLSEVLAEYGRGAHHMMDGAGTTLAICICVTFTHGSMAGVTRVIKATLGDSSILHVELTPESGGIVSADVTKASGWDELSDYAEYLADLAAYNQAREETPLEPCQVYANRAITSPMFLVHQDQVVLNHLGVIRQIRTEYANPNPAAVGGVQASRERRRIAIKTDSSGGELRYRIYAHTSLTEPTDWIYTGHCDTGAVGQARGSSPQFRSSFGDATTSQALGLLNIPKVSISTIRGPVVFIAMSDGMADALSDPDMVETAARHLRSGGIASDLATELVERARQISLPTWGRNHDDISCVVAVIGFGQ